MAVLSIREYEHLSDVAGGSLQVALEPAVASQSVAIGGASVASSAFNIQTRYIRLQADIRCSIEFGTAPVATATTCPLAAGQTEYFGVVTGQKVAVITA